MFDFRQRNSYFFIFRCHEPIADVISNSGIVKNGIFDVQTFQLIKKNTSGFEKRNIPMPRDSGHRKILLNKKFYYL